MYPKDNRQDLLSKEPLKTQAEPEMMTGKEIWEDTENTDWTVGLTRRLIEGGYLKQLPNGEIVRTDKPLGTDE